MAKSYNYDDGHNNGNVMSVTNNRDANRTQTFTYDPLNRITSGWSQANSGALSWGENYTIDAWGNLQMAPMANKAHGGSFQIASDGNNHATGLPYDAAGNLTAYNSSAYTYDAGNMMKTVGSTTYWYDADGQRFQKWQSGTGSKTYWYGAGGETLGEGDAAGNLTSEYVYFGGKRTARIDLPANTVHYYLSDHLNSTSQVVSSSGVIEEESDYSPFGAEVSVTGPGANHYKYGGHERDNESGLDYFGARYYSNGLGRFVTPDWAAKATAVPYGDFADPQSLNLYSYVRNVPTTLSDPDGHNWLTDELKKAGTGVLKALGAAALTPTPERKLETQTHTTGERVKQQVEEAQRETAPPKIVIPHGKTETIAFGLTAAALVLSGTEEEVSASRGVVLRTLASEAQVAELLAGQGEVIAGPAARKALNDAPRLAAEYGGAPTDWVKISSSHYTPPGSEGAQTGFATHAYQNVKTGQTVEMKSVPDQIHNVR